MMSMLAVELLDVDGMRENRLEQVVRLSIGCVSEAAAS